MSASLETLWLGIGLLGQALFSARFLVQWIASEKRKQSVVPVYFWYFSIGGGLTLLLYAIYRQDPVFILGQAAGLVVYLRNLYFIHRPSGDVPPMRVSVDPAGAVADGRRQDPVR